MFKSEIKIHNLSKRYRLGLKEKRSETLLGQIGQAICSPWENLKELRKLNRFGEEDESVFWALRDINFEVKAGEVLGIIGKNGAGKSTLLKILSQITEPTSGKIEIQGRIASLLEVGTGFHPELSGRENIYMNGTILGMTKREIDSKLDEIIDFSGIEKFMDTPVKFYSSGMKVRLGFSVAAHLEPEIMIIDEVLAVGDFEFQAKCIGKMENVSKQGRTVLFVSHNLEAIRNLCTRTLLLKNGRIVFNGNTEDAVKKYLDKGEISHAYSHNLMNHPDKKKQGIGLTKAEIKVDGELSNEIFAGQKLSIILFYHVELDDLNQQMDVGFGLFDSEGKGLLAFNNTNFKKKVTLSQTDGQIEITLPNFPFYSSDSLSVSTYFGYMGDYYEVLEHAAFIICTQNDYLGSGLPLNQKHNSVYISDVEFVVC